MVVLVKKADTSWDPACENKGAYFLGRETTWGCVHWNRTCCSSWTLSSASQRSQFRGDLWFQVAVS